MRPVSTFFDIQLSNSREEKILLSLNEVSKLLNISYGKARDFTFEQNMQVRIGRRTLVHKAKLEKWINDQVKLKNGCGYIRFYLE